MARWRLIEGHYLNVPNTEWVYEETDRNTGKRNRKTYMVPALLNPNDAADHNYPGEIIVCHEGKGERRDIIFVGDPTPAMEPLDEEAEKISAALRQRWENPIESLPANGGMNAAEMSFMQKLMESFGEANKPVPNEDVEALKKQVAALTEQIAKMASAPAPATTVRRS